MEGFIDLRCTPGHKVPVTRICIYRGSQLNWLIYMGNVGKYTIHGSYGFGPKKTYHHCMPLLLCHVSPVVQECHGAASPVPRRPSPRRSCWWSRCRKKMPNKKGPSWGYPPRILWFNPKNVTSLTSLKTWWTFCWLLHVTYIWNNHFFSNLVVSFIIWRFWHLVVGQHSPPLKRGEFVQWLVFSASVPIGFSWKNGIFAYIWLNFYGKCRYIYHTWFLWDILNCCSNKPFDTVCGDFFCWTWVVIPKFKEIILRLISPW